MTWATRVGSSSFSFSLMSMVCGFGTFGASEDFLAGVAGAAGAAIGLASTGAGVLATSGLA